MTRSSAPPGARSPSPGLLDHRAEHLVQRRRGVQRGQPDPVRRRAVTGHARRARRPARWARRRPAARRAAGCGPGTGGGSGTGAAREPVRPHRGRRRRPDRAAVGGRRRTRTPRGTGSARRCRWTGTPSPGTGGRWCASGTPSTARDSPGGERAQRDPVGQVRLQPADPPLVQALRGQQQVQPERAAQPADHDEQVDELRALGEQLGELVDDHQQRRQRGTGAPRWRARS